MGKGAGGSNGSFCLFSERLVSSASTFSVATKSSLDSFLSLVGRLTSFSCSQEHKNSNSNEAMKVFIYINYFFLKKCIVASPLGIKLNFRIT